MEESYRLDLDLEPGPSPKSARDITQGYTARSPS
jgi:hypothetical protein